MQYTNADTKDHKHVPNNQTKKQKNVENIACSFQTRAAASERKSSVADRKQLRTMDDKWSWWRWAKTTSSLEDLRNSLAW